MKSDSGSGPRPTKWRLKRTLKRSVEFRPIEDEDMRFIWAAYKKGALKTMGEKYADGEMPADHFKAEFTKDVLERYHAAWVLFAPTKRGQLPVGVVFAAWAPNDAPYMIVTGMCWFPWSSPRNKVESMVNFLNKIRKELMLMFYALPEHKRLYEVCAMHAIVRRVGTSYTAIPGHSAALFETKAA
jgi:hypothetical protein